MTHVAEDKVALTGKRLEMFQRDEAHLELARSIFLNEGWQELTFANLSKRTGFARSRFYERFGSKEGLITEIALRGQRELLTAVYYASRFPGRPRERLFAVAAGIARYLQRHTDNERIFGFANSLPVLEKLPPETQAEMAHSELAALEIAEEIVKDAVREGDLELPDSSLCRTIAFGLWTVQAGLFSGLRLPPFVERSGAATLIADFYTNAQHLADSYGWKPLSTEHDWDATSRRIAKYLNEATPLESPTGTRYWQISDTS